MWGWPTRAVKITVELIGTKTQTLKELQTDVNTFRILKGLVEAGDANAFVKQLVTRSGFNWVAVQQLVAIAEQEQWVLTGQFQDLALCCCLALCIL